MNLISIKGRVAKMVKAIKPGRPPVLVVGFKYPEEWLSGEVGYTTEELDALEWVQFEEAKERYRIRHPGHDPLLARTIVVGLHRG